MESLLGFEDTTSTIAVEKNSSNGHKLVPWLNWEEWDFVKDSLFSSSSQSVSAALNRISAWRSRGCLPVAVEVTAPVIEIQQKDPFFREDDTLNNLHSEEMLAMLYSMAIMRFVNVVVEKTRKHTQASIAEAADMVGIPRMLIDIRHEGAHRDLPSLRLLRLASVKVLDWLKSNYWEPQKNIVTFQEDSIAKIRKEIKSRLRELTLSLKVKESPESTSALVKAKRVTQPQRLSGRNKLSLTAGKPYFSKSVGSKKQTRTTMKHLLRLHSSFSSEVVSVLLEYLLKATDSEDLVEAPKDSQDDSSLDKALFVCDDLKLVVTKLSKKEPKFLLALLNAVIDMIQTQRDVKYEIGEQHFIPFEYGSQNHQTERLSLLFAWLVRIQKIPKLPPISGSLDENEDCSTNTSPKATMVSLIRKSLLVLPPDSEHLMGSILHLAQMTGDKSLIAKLNKISSLYVNVTEENSSILLSDNLIHQDDYIRGAAHKLEVLKLRKSKTTLPKTIEKFDVGKSNKWEIAKSWNKCPIGMLPSTLGSSGRLPSLDAHDVHDNSVIKVEPLVVKKELKGLNQYGKREARCDIEMLDSTNVKKMKETVEQCEIEKDEDDSRLGNIKGQLMINGVWRRITEEELLAISSDIRIFI